MKDLHRFIEEPGREPKLDDFFCANALRVSTEAMHEAVLRARQERVLSPAS